MKSSIQKRTPKTVDDYLARVPAAARATLEKVRRTIRSAAPSSVESIGYGIPIVKLQGMLVGFAAFKNHCRLFPMSKAVMKRYATELKRYETSKGTIRFPIGQPPPPTLIRKIVKARLAEKKAQLSPSTAGARRSLADRAKLSSRARVH